MRNSGNVWFGVVIGLIMTGCVLKVVVSIMALVPAVTP